MVASSSIGSTAPRSTTLAAFSGLLLILNPTEALDFYEAIVIGAGWAGLGAAKTLQPKFSVLVLDAHDYVGGRCKSTEIYEGAIYEEGTSYLTGIGENLVYDLGVSMGTEFVPHDYLYGAYRDGAPFPNNGTVIFDNFYNGIWAAWSDQYYDGMLGYESSLADVIEVYNATELELQPGTDEAALFAAASERVSYDYAAVLEKFAVGGGNENVDGPGGIVLPKNGLSTIVNKYAESLLPNIRLNSKVTRIDYSRSPALVTYVDTESGTETTVEAGKVLVTVPFGVLKAGDIEFVPSFAENGEAGERKQASIDNMNPGKYEKIALFWKDMTKDEIFWNTDIQHAMHVQKNEPDQQGNFTHWNSYYHVAGIPMLESSASQRFVDIIENLTDEQVVAQAVEKLRQYYGRDVVPEPTHHFIPRWYADEYTKTIYAYAEPGAGYEVRTDLGATLNDTLFFAGEATYELRFGTVHGALVSGLEAAENMFPVTANPTATTASPTSPTATTASPTSSPFLTSTSSAPPSRMSSPTDNLKEKNSVADPSAAAFLFKVFPSLLCAGFGTIMLVL